MKPRPVRLGDIILEPEDYLPRKATLIKVLDEEPVIILKTEEETYEVVGSLLPVEVYEFEGQLLYSFGGFSSRFVSSRHGELPLGNGVYSVTYNRSISVDLGGCAVGLVVFCAGWFLLIKLALLFIYTFVVGN